MKPTAALSEFRFYYGCTALNFTGTLGRRLSEEPLERLDTPKRLSHWLLEAQVLSAAAPVTAKGLRDAIALREAIAHIARSCVDEEKPPERAVAIVNRFAAPPPVSLKLTAGGTVKRSGTPPLGAALSTIARDAIELFAGERRTLIRACAMDDCGGFYIDDSRGKRRRWCSMERCGNRAKAETYRERWLAGI